MIPLHKAISFLLVASVALNVLTAWRILSPRRAGPAFDAPLASEAPLANSPSETLQHHITADAEWDTLLPPHGAQITLGSEEFDVGLFSDLGCLQTIRDAFLLLRNGATGESFAAAEACLGQIRQAIMCNSDLTLEPAYLVCDAEEKCAPAATGDHVAHRCRNWAQVREFVEENQASREISER
ncbi:hypothetical protein B0H14DRAFT_3039899 [Mycena olivaceomarginata]|nr:hypothetical protein B0H14DRAFT_3039899 [Mycena olivaceomarginata]